MTSFFEHQKVKYKKSYLMNLIMIACSDGDLDFTERELLKTIGLKRGLKLWQIEALFASVAHCEFFIPENVLNRLALLYDIMLLVTSDNRIDDNEQLLIESTLSRLGFSVDLKEQVITIFEHGKPTQDEWMDFQHKTLEEYEARNAVK